MTASGRDLQCAFGEFLPSDFGEAGAGRFRFGDRVRLGRGDWMDVSKVAKNLGQIFGGKHFELLAGQGSGVGTTRRQDQLLDSVLLESQSHGERSSDRSDSSIEGQFAEKGRALHGSVFDGGA